MSRGADARRQLASCRAGVLSTLSQRHGGHPFGSHDAALDPLAGARVTLLGRAVPLEASNPAAERYRRLFPDSEGLLALGDFSFFVLEPLAVRFIEGFGSIHWISAAEYLDSDVRA